MARGWESSVVSGFFGVAISMASQCQTCRRDLHWAAQAARVVVGGRALGLHLKNIGKQQQQQQQQQQQEQEQEQQQQQQPFKEEYKISVWGQVYICIHIVTFIICFVI